ncbi:hypothetical protein [Dyadobacter frigoris]|uniref:Uncharacterized protein n=1 Tax=Dyadobacter frigoris TaxID=2576211 RepID=A0A4U6D4U8_9BACT|nr:hypothetical protein [Dyadobacter frigoris]TKT92349.1 hypothetical protein FDK13_10260 [Dyadobacter frigoris]GLU53537.1 hypothetical protein Dfri01_29980 [Dyadobacter frigoris]
MEEDKEDLFKKLIRQSEPDKMTPDFTQNVMRMVQAEELVRESSLRTLLITNEADKPSFSFERKVMAQITPAAKRVEKPIISRNAWYLTAAFFALMIGYSIFAKSPQPITSNDSPPFEIAKSLTIFSVNVTQLPVIYSIVITALCVLLLADYFILQRLGKRAVH